jgi:hypothetical protein
MYVILMIGAKPHKLINTDGWFDEFRATYPTPEDRRIRALGFIVKDGQEPVTEGLPIRLALAAQWNDPEVSFVEGAPSLRDTARYLGVVGSTVRAREQQKVAIFSGLDPKELKARVIAPPEKGFKIKIGTMATGEIKWRLDDVPRTWYEQRGVPLDARALAFHGSIKATDVVELNRAEAWDATIKQAERANLPFYAARVCLEPNPNLYERSRVVSRTHNIVFGNESVEESMADLERHADTLELPISAIYQLSA